MSASSPAAPPSQHRRASVGLGVKITRDRAGLLSALAAIDDDGWDSLVGESLLVYVRATVVRPHLVHTRLCNAAREQAEATAWEASRVCIVLMNCSLMGRRTQSPAAPLIQGAPILLAPAVRPFDLG